MHFSPARSCISAYEADILAGMGSDLGEGARDEGEGGVIEVGDARRERRMYFAVSLSISCCNSSAEISAYKGQRKRKGRAHLVSSFRDALSLGEYGILHSASCRYLAFRSV